MATENGDIGISKISFLEMNGQSVVDLNTEDGMSKWVILNSHYKMTKEVLRMKGV